MKASIITKINKSCYNCIHGTKVLINADVICMINGAVSYDFCCKNHKFIPAKAPINKTEFKCIDCEHFILSARTVEVNPISVLETNVIESVNEDNDINENKDISEDKSTNQDVNIIEYKNINQCKDNKAMLHVKKNTYGVCHLFSVRECDGSIKKACSKFTPIRP